MAFLNLSNLSDLVRTSVICLSPVVAWLQFQLKSREKYQLSKLETKSIFHGIKSEIENIGRWTGGGWEETAHNSNWYLPWWRVNKFDWERIRSFNKGTVYTIYRNDNLSKALENIETSIKLFESKLLDHMDIVRRYSDDWLEKFKLKHGKLKEKENVEYQDLLSPGRSFGYDVSKINSTLLQKIEDLGIDEFDLTRLNDIYEFNRRIHVDGIGDGKKEVSLFSLRQTAEDEIVKAIEAVDDLKQSKWLWIGNSLALVFLFIGIFYLVGFFWGIDFSNPNGG